MGTVHAMPAAQLDPPPTTEKWFEHDKKGRVVFTGQTYEDHVAAWDDAQIEVEAGLWGQAQIAASLVTKYNESTVKRFAHDVKVAASWVWALAKTYRAFSEKSTRVDYLSFTHHRIASTSEKYGTPQEVLEKAHDNEWSTRELKEYVETGIEPEPKGAKRTEPKDPILAIEIAKLHDNAVREELTAKVAAIRPWQDETTDPLLASVYHRLVTMLEWQRDRTVEKDCNAIMEIFTEQEGMEMPEYVNESYIQSWLGWRGRLMHKSQLKARIETLKSLKMLTDYSRKRSKGVKQRGAVTPVFAPCDAYLAKLEDFAFISDAPDRRDAMHKDWIERAQLYAPELLPKEEKAA